MAMPASVTVSMAALSSGIRTEIRFETRLVVSVPEGMTSDSFGRSSTSSNVRPSIANFSGTPAAFSSAPMGHLS